MNAYPEIDQDYEMGKVVTQIKVQNLGDIERLAAGDDDPPGDKDRGCAGRSGSECRH